MAGVMGGKVVVITGAGSGMARSAAKLFHSEGAQLVLADISGKEAETAGELGDRAVAINTDVTKDAQVRAMIDCAISTYGRLDALLNVAGSPGQQVSLAETSEELFDQMVDINLRGVFLGMKHAIPHMLKQGAGSIVNVASTAALIAAPKLGAYAAAKAGVVALTRTAAVEYGRLGIRCNAICPGPFNTPMTAAAALEDPSVGEYFANLVPMGRIGEPEEIAEALLYLASARASYVNGAVLPVEGGQTAA
jgi:NAD(P)-dependent dehydrogenase (short-subunit alcohol dehydrogenase family)